jgi:hypothetical protein
MPKELTLQKKEWEEKKNGFVLRVGKTRCKGG